MLVVASGAVLLLAVALLDRSLSKEHGHKVAFAVAALAVLAAGLAAGLTTLSMLLARRATATRAVRDIGVVALVVASILVVVDGIAFLRAAL